MNVTAALNRKYLMYTIVMLTSLCENNKEEHIDVYILNTELTETDFQTLRGALSPYDVSVTDLRIPADRIDGVLPKPWLKSWTVEIYDRLFLAELLPQEVDRIFYFDVDMIVNRSLVDLYHMDLEDKDLWVVEDCESAYFTEQMNEKLHKIGAPTLREGYRYFNSGMLLLNMERMREYSFDFYLATMKKWEYAMTAPDQDVLNYVHGERAGYLPADRYNLFARYAHQHGVTYEEVRDGAAVIHFTGDKPWRTDGLHYDIEQLWWDYARCVPQEIYHQLLEDFQISTIGNPELEKMVRQLADDNQRMIELSQKLLSKFQNA